MKTILVLSFSDLARDPRVNRQIRLLSALYKVTAMGYVNPGLTGVEFVEIQPMARSLYGKIGALAALMLGKFETYYWGNRLVQQALNKLTGRKHDLILANDLDTLPLALKLAGAHAKVVFDAHEYAPREFEDIFLWRIGFQRYIESMCAKYIPCASAMITVCQGIANEYAREYGVLPTVMMNAPIYQKQQPTQMQPGAIRMIHHGIAIPSRRLELMIEVMKLVDRRFQLDFMLLPGQGDYLEKLRRMAAGMSNVRFLAPVGMNDLPRVCNQYDLGIFLLPPTNFNYAHALPNKFFEFIQGRIAVAIGPTPEMAALIRQYECGIVAENFAPESLARKLNQLTHEQVMAYKWKAHVAAQDLCFEPNAQILLRIVEQLLRVSQVN